MAKAVLVMDMPECCADCRVATSDLEGLYHCAITDNYYSIDESLNGRDSSCPLRELPEKETEMTDADDLGVDYVRGTMDGWNACLDEILKERDADGTH
jgi:hypothetical protein